MNIDQDYEVYVNVICYEFEGMLCEDVMDIGGYIFEDETDASEGYYYTSNSLECNVCAEGLDKVLKRVKEMQDKYLVQLIVRIEYN